MVSHDAVVIVAMVLDEMIFDFEIFPLMVCVSQESNVDCMCYINGGEYNRHEARVCLFIQRLVLFVGKLYGVIFI